MTPLNIHNLLLRKFEINKSEIFDELNLFQRSSNQYRLIELASDFILRLEKVSGDLDFCSNINFHAGFPFPIDSFICNNLGIIVSNNIKVDFFLRGEDVRKKQRNELLENADNVNIIKKVADFRKIIQSDLETAESFLYVDPYNFIGDSIIGLYYLESFKKRFNNIDSTHVFSNASQHIKVLYPTSPKTINEILSKITPNCFLLMPDLIDNQWQFTTNLISELGDIDYRVVVPGRNLYIRNKNSVRELFWLKRNDFLLRNQNIEDYMIETLNPFLGSKFKKPSFEKRLHSKKTNCIYLNPFASKREKVIPVHIFSDICKGIARNYGFQFKLIGGLRQDDFQQQWVHDFTNRARVSNEIKLDVIYYKNLSEFSLDLMDGCATVITADTSIAHMANHCGCPNIVLYNSNVWDSCSAQSMSSDSPLGFCRYSELQFPVILEENSGDQIISDILNLIGIISSSRQLNNLGIGQKPGQVDWLSNLYDPLDLTECLRKKRSGVSKLLHAAIKISPQYKIANIRDF
ncbi:MAG: glycosyltransferase family 9 protein [Candidatus Paceibacterota bacterium]|jgi:ADP-heptose:LPS heptosyltransferase